ncbi:Ras-related GTP-binding protein C [Sarcoptes scabiei]|nr:Ras-related GTP-binding protein C [Sarcoptes scabiei]
MISSSMNSSFRDMESYREYLVPGSFPKSYNYPNEEESEHQHHHDVDVMQYITNDIKPKIMIMGPKRSGKSSIQKVVFHKMSPNETLFLESTNKIVKDANNSFISFSIWDFPGQLDVERELEFDNLFPGCGALVFVIDSQDDYGDALVHLNHIIRKAHQVNPNINFEIFIHKIDGLSDDHKIEARQDIHQRATEDLMESGEDISLSFYLTSIYDHSIFEAFSKVVQKLIPQMPILENLLNVFISSSGIEKAYLFDVVSKIFIATDSSPVDMQSYELCCDMIDVVIDISCIYGINEDGDGSTFDHFSSSSIRLNSGTVLYLREVNKFLALVCILREENFTKQGLIDYNFQCFRQSIQDVFVHRINESRLSQNNSLIPIETPYGSSSQQAIDVDVLAVEHHHPNSSQNSLQNNLIGQSNYEQDAYSLDQDIIDKQSSFFLTPNNLKKSSATLTSASHRKIAIIPQTTIASSLPTATKTNNSMSSNSHKTKIHSPNVLSSNNYHHSSPLEPRFV